MLDLSSGTVLRARPYFANFVDHLNARVSLTPKRKRAALYPIAKAWNLNDAPDKIQALDRAPESSLELDSYSRTTIRHSNKPRPWCRRIPERCRRIRHN